jgi:leucyl-tRNA synthetase
VREAWDLATKSTNDKELNGKISKMGETKKSMPFLQRLKKRLVGGEIPETVSECKLAFDEVQTLENMVPGLKKAAGLSVVELVEVAEGGKTGKVVGEREVTGLPPNAESAVPGM